MTGLHGRLIRRPRSWEARWDPECQSRYDDAQDHRAVVHDHKGKSLVSYRSLAR